MDQPIQADKGRPAQLRRPNLGRKVMEWFSRKTSIAGIQIPNWLVALGAIIVLLLIYSFIQEAEISH
jgi:type VI protein secretion system component VasF